MTENKGFQFQISRHMLFDGTSIVVCFLDFIHNEVKHDTVLSVASRVKLKNHKQNDRSSHSNHGNLSVSK